jgi:tRNA pseudouridine38-40 synthase
VKALNAILPPDVRVKQAWEVPQSFHCTLDAKAKLYRYVIDNNPIADPFQLRYSYHVYRRLDADAMGRAAQALKGRHDFRSFETNWPNRTSSVRTITQIAACRVGEFVRVEVEADGFLYNMVRSITGTLILVGLGRWPESKVAEALRAEDRREAGPTAPPQGLFLVRVRYAEDPVTGL